MKAPIALQLLSSRLAELAALALAHKGRTLNIRRLFLVAAILLAGNAAAQSIEDVVKSGKIAYRAFECSHLASSQSDEMQKSRLFDLGLSEARKVADAYISGRISQDQLSKGEIMATFFLDGPTPDFMAGRMYEGAGSHVWMRIKLAAGADASVMEMQRVTANMYEDKNCDLLGVGR